MSRLRRVTGALIAAGMLLPAMVGSISAQDASLCESADAAGPGAVIDGYTVVLNTGRAGHEIVLGYGGASLSGASGNDVLCAWGGNNTLDGGSGNDVLIVMEGTGNTLIGRSGNDTLIGYVGDVFNGGSGRNDIIQNEVPTPEILGTWEGIVEQSNISYTATVTITGGSPGTLVGSSNYPELRCGGNLELVSSEPGRLTLIEQLTYNEEACVTETVVILELQPDGSLLFGRRLDDSSPIEGSGTLYPVP